VTRLAAIPLLVTRHWPELRADPPPGYAPESYAARLYLALAPLAQDDESTGWNLLVYVNAHGTMFQLVEGLVRDTADGPGWSPLLNLQLCPPDALPWLGQMIGVRIPPGVTDPAAQRRWIAETDGWSRGTTAALMGACRATLTGKQRIVFRERDGAVYGDGGSPNYAYHLTVNTYTSETPDPTATLNALLAQKPGGIVLHYATVTGQDYLILQTNHATYADVKAAYATYYGVKTDTPGQ